MGTSSKRLYYLDSLKYIFCLMIFWAHLAGVFWTLCDPRPELRPELEQLFTYPLSVLVDSSLALYGFCILSGYLASFKRTTAQNLLPQLLARYLRFVVPFFFINLFALILYYTVGYPTAEASALLHNAWLATYYTHAPTIPELLRATFTLNGDLNGPLWMMKYILLGTCIIYLYNAAERKLQLRARSASADAGVQHSDSCHVQDANAGDRNVVAGGDCARSGLLPLRLFQFTCLAVFVYSFFHLPEPNFLRSTKKADTRCSASSFCCSCCSRSHWMPAACSAYCIRFSVHTVRRSPLCLSGTPTGSCFSASASSSAS